MASDGLPSEYLRLILEGIADGVSVQDGSGRILFVNDTVAALSGYASGADLMAAKPGEALGKFEICRENGDPFPIEDLPNSRSPVIRPRRWCATGTARRGSSAGR
jgi:PAS domain-containing protein